MARYVLVHGAWHAAWAWEGVVEDLTAAGHTATAIDLPGHGDDVTPHGDVTLDLYARRICEEVAKHDGPVVLVGHSMGGIAITQAAERCPDDIALLVYVCAFLPRNGESLQALAALPENPNDSVMPNARIEPPVVHLPPDAARAAFYHRCAPEDADNAVARLGPQPLEPLAAPVAITPERAGRLPRAYVLCADDQAIPIALQRRMVEASPCQDVIELDTDHSPFLCARTELVGVLKGLGAGARPV